MRVACLLLVPLVLLLEAGGDPVREALRLEGGALGAGQAWRLVSGHFVHLGWGHALVNAAALVAVGAAFGPVFRGIQWLIIALGSLLVIDVGLLWIAPVVEWYVGLSGLLHGLVAAGAIGLFSRGERRLASLVLAALVAKLAWESAVGPVPYSAGLAGGPIVVQAHLWGAIGGGAFGALLIRTGHAPV